MVWRGSTSPSDRFFSCLLYVLPLLDVLQIVVGVLINGDSMFRPVLIVLAELLSPIAFLNAGLIGFAIFLAIYMLVVRNDRLPHFLRFNAMQSILIGIVLSLFSILWSYGLGAVLSAIPLLTETIFNTLFLGTIAAVGYSVVQSALGKYAEIPVISDAVYSQLRY